MNPQLQRAVITLIGLVVGGASFVPLFAPMAEILRLAATGMIAKEWLQPSVVKP
jgi:hypothetical protein